MPTPEEIKSIAHEYARCTCIVTFNAEQRAEDEKIEYDFALPVLEWLSERYCIVEKSKVIGLWNEINNDAKVNIENGFPDYAEFNKLQLTPLEILFGKDMFEEEGE